MNHKMLATRHLQLWIHAHVNGDADLQLHILFFASTESSCLDTKLAVSNDVASFDSKIIEIKPSFMVSSIPIS